MKLVHAKYTQALLLLRRPPCCKSTARHTRHARHVRLDSLDTSNVSSRDVTNQVEFWLYSCDAVALQGPCDCRALPSLIVVINHCY